MTHRLRSSATLVVVALLSLLLIGTAAARQKDGKAAPGKGATNVYLVQLEEPPVVAYEGGLPGLAATAPAKGKKVNPIDANVQKYVAHLRSRHDAIADSAGASKFYDYEYALNGFAAELTDAQAAKLRTTSGVLAVERDQRHELATDNTPTFLGLNASGGIWSQLGGQGNAGEGVIIGFVDTGIWPEHPSFSPEGFGPPPASWHGDCQSGELFTQSDCNNKLIGANYFLEGFGHSGLEGGGDYKSARDHDGHGTHTTSTAGGNANVQASIFGIDRGRISGMAPRARVAAYKACWSGKSGEGCFSSDTVAAINKAVADGVDVINYSISGTETNYLDSVEIAFLMARRNGVFAATSAGNDGPGPSTVNHISPWLMSVGASTQNRSFVGTTTLGNRKTYKGVTITAGLGSTPLVDGASAGSEGCLTGLTPALVTGRIVVCKGSFQRAARSLAVKQAGGVGMILYAETDTDALLSDNHHVPALHVSFTTGSAIKAYIAAAGSSATASLSGGSKEFGGGNTMAAFSSRGPTIAGSRDVVKPDITAPGVQILAGNSPTATVGAAGQLFQAIAGTSMSSPHVAGIAALVVDLHPDWTPAEVQSAIMTSARQNVALEDGSTPAGPFGFGAGHVAPNGAANPGLVYPADFDEYRAFLRSQGLCTFCFGTAPAPVKDPSDVNLPSIQIGALAGVQAVTRTVKNVGPAGTYKVSVDAPAGISVAVSPTELSLAAGQSATYQVTFTTDGRATFDAYASGAITWSAGGKGGQSVRIPVVVRPVKISAPVSISATGTSGSETRSVIFGYAGQFTASPQGLIPATTETRTVVDDPTNNFVVETPDANQGIQVHTFAIPAGTVHARFSLFDDFTDGNDDLDIYLYNPTGQLVGVSAGGTSAEEINLVKPAAGTYKLYVHGWQTDGPEAVYTLFSWLLGNAAAGNMTVTSSTSNATVGGTGTITVAWSGLTAGTKYLGRISYGDGSSEIGSTIVRIDG
jgi:subtilisin family serine protease